MINQLKQSDLDDLKAHIDVNGSSREMQCGNILKNFAGVLLSHDHNYSYSSAEIGGMTGRSDLIVVATSTTAAGNPHTCAFVWELKAPQLSPFSTTNRSRANPTEHLCSAENQLLHYVDEYKNNAAFKGRFRVDNVKAGGIIIGRLDNFCKNTTSLDSPVAKNLGDFCLKLRQDHFYRGTDINFYTWTQIHNLLIKTHQGAISSTVAIDAVPIFVETDMQVNGLSIEMPNIESRAQFFGRIFLNALLRAMGIH